MLTLEMMHLSKTSIIIIVFIFVSALHVMGKEINLAVVSQGSNGGQMGYEDWGRILSIDWESGNELLDSEYPNNLRPSTDRHFTEIPVSNGRSCEHSFSGPSCKSTSKSECTCCMRGDEDLQKDGRGVWPFSKTKEQKDPSQRAPKHASTFVALDDPNNPSPNQTDTGYNFEVRKQSTDSRTSALGNLRENNRHRRQTEKEIKLGEEMKTVEEKLSAVDKWHFMVGYTDFTALREAESLIKNSVQHVSTMESVKYFLAFIPKHLADQMRSNPKFLIVKPLVGSLKIEGLNLGRRIRNVDSRRQERSSPRADISLKANLAKDELTVQQAIDLSRRWENIFRTNNWHLSSGGKCATGMNPSCALSFSKSTIARAQQHAQRVKCVAPDETTIVCHFIHNQILKYVTEFMASEALVQLVEVKPSYKVFNYWSKPLLQSVSRGHTPMYEAGIRGEGEIIAHADTGIDMKHCFFFDKDRPVPFNYVNYDARKVIQYTAMEGGDFFDTPLGHGTHVAGSIAGDTEIGGDSFSGMAPAAKIAFFDMGSGSHEILSVPNNIGKGLFAYGYLTGARIFCNSWGDRLKGYGSGPHDVDSFAYENQDVLILFAAGNDGNRGASTIASPAVSKNCLAVGASLNSMDSFQSILPSDELLPFEFLATVAPFSSVGPTLDGRTKPDILAPGMEIWSSSSNGATGAQSCQVLPRQGTSCATPLIAGAAALARQYFREGYYPLGSKNSTYSFTPTGALLKAILIHSGVHMDAYFSPVHLERLAYQPPNNMEGYGRVILERALLFSSPLEGRSKGPSRLLVKSGAFHGATLKHGEKHVLQIHVLSKAEALHVTMVWMDPPAASGSKNPMINDLDLVVTAYDQVYFPNGMTSKDFTNNVEAVLVTKPTPGKWTVEVKASTIVSKHQPYALVLTGHFVVLDDKVSNSHKRCSFLHFGIIGFFYHPFILVFLTSWLLK